MRCVHWWKFRFYFYYLGSRREEVFGPVAPLVRFHTDEEAIKMANDTEYGMSLRVFRAIEGDILLVKV